MALTTEDKRWLTEHLSMLATKDDLARLRTDLIGEDAKLLRELRAYVKSRVSTYHPEEQLTD